MKRFFDLVVATLALLLLGIPLLLLIWEVRRKMGAPVFYRQMRPGLHGRPFQLVKFRTMTETRDLDGYLLPDADRLTKFGSFLRASSLDELPELWNVLKGDMSLVGPRPLLIEYLPLYSSNQARRHEVRPGITGWAQINGRNAISWDEKFKLDVWYVDNSSFWLDIKIIYLSIIKTIQRDGINADGEVSMSKFTGTKKTIEGSRFGNWRNPKIEEGIPTKYHWLVQNVDGLELGFKTDIGAFTYINAKFGVTLGERVQIGSHCSIYSISTIDDKQGKVVMKKNSKLGSHSTVLPSVTIGQNSIVGAHSLVNKDIPDNCIAVGVPAKVVKKLPPK